MFVTLFVISRSIVPSTTAILSFFHILPLCGAFSIILNSNEDFFRKATTPQPKDKQRSFAGCVTSLRRSRARGAMTGNTWGSSEVSDRRLRLVTANRTRNSHTIPNKKDFPSKREEFWMIKFYWAFFLCSEHDTGKMEGKTVRCSKIESISH